MMITIVSFPIKNADLNHSCVSHYQSVHFVWEVSEVTHGYPSIIHVILRFSIAVQLFRYFHFNGTPMC